MTKQQRKVLSTLLRVVLGLVFITLAVHGVAVHDRVTIQPAEGDVEGKQRRYRLLGATETTITVRDSDGTELVLPRERVATDEQGSESIERGLVTAFRSSDGRILLLAFVVFSPVTFIQSLRFQFMLRAQEIRISYWESVKLCFGGNFLNFAFPIGSTGGDVLKAYYTSLHTTRKTEAVTTILLDRIAGLSGLLVVAGAVSFTGSAHPMLRKVGATACVLMGIFLVGAWMAISPRITNLAPRRLLSRLPGADHISRIHGATERLIRHLPTVGLCLLLSVVLQSIALGACVLCAYALGMDFSGARAWDYFAFIGAGQLVAAIPISVLGLGTMEFAYKQFFLDAYGTLPQLLCLALWVRLLQLFWALPGAVVTLFGSYRPRRLAAEVEQERLD